MSLTVSLVALLAAREFLGAVAKESHAIFRLSGLVLTATLPLVIFFRGLDLVAPYLVASILVLFVVAIFTSREAGGILHPAIAALASIVYIGLTLGFIVSLAGLNEGRWWMLLSLIVVWTNDTFAYYTGKNLGRHKLCPTVSPGKTIEGAVGGLIGAVIAAPAFTYFAGLDASFTYLALVGLLLGIIAVLGDLVESAIKRSIGIKDSGGIIPGHGGVLDRIDSLLFVVPALYYLIVFSNIA